MIDKKRITAYNIKEVPKTRLKIYGSTYKVSSCIFHHGLDIKKVNYSVMMRDEACSRNSVDDQNVRKSPWPKNAKNAYILFWEEV